MAEPIGLASGLVALSVYAFKASVTLFETVQSFKNYPKRVRDLVEEIESLSGVLGPLADTVKNTTEVDLSALKFPLQRCGNACEEFRQELIKCSSRSADGRKSFRDWSKLKYLRDDIDGFRLLLAGYRMTIVVALTDANIRKSSITTERIESCRELISTTTQDLEARIESIDEKLDVIFSQTAARSDSDASEVKAMQEERLSTEKCLQICAQLTDYINQIQLNPSAGPFSAGPDSIPERFVNEGLLECKKSLGVATGKLEDYIEVLVDRMVTKSGTAMASEEERTDLGRLREELKAVRQCRDICSKAGDHLKENISVMENYATGDAVQFMVSTNGKTLHGKNSGLGWRTKQVGGHLSDESLQSLSRDMFFRRIHEVEHHEAPPQGIPPTTTGSDDGPADSSNPDFKNRWGPGQPLVFKTPSDASPGSSRIAK